MKIITDIPRVILCHIFGHRINEYRAARSPVPVAAMGCSRCHQMIDVQTMQVRP